MSYAGFYINLDDSADRRAEIEAELDRYGLRDRYQRVAATKGNALGFPNPRLSPSEVGCFTSHYLALKNNGSAARHLHILEDDAVLCGFTGHTLRWAIESGVIDQFDILFTDTFVTPLNGEYQYCKALYDRSVERGPSGGVTAVRSQIVKHIAGMNSYLVNRASIGKLISIYERELGAGARHPIDLAVRVLSERGDLRTGALFPFTTSVRLSRTLDTTLPGRRQDDLTAVAAWIGRNSFFVGADMHELRTQAERLLQVPDSDPHHQTLARILAFSLTDKYHPF